MKLSGWMDGWMGKKIALGLVQLGSIFLIHAGLLIMLYTY